MDNTDGFKIIGESSDDQSGTSVSSAGDINGDGYDDLIIGAPNATSNGNSGGTSYVVYGNYSEYKREGKTPTSIDPNIGTYLDDDLELGDYGTVLIGGAGNDTLTIDSVPSNRIDGGSGEDKLVLNGIGLDFTNGNYHTSIQNIEEIDITNPAHTLALRPIDLVNLSTTSNQLTVSGGILDLYQGPSDGAGWYQQEDTNTNSWANYVNNTVINIGDNVIVNYTNLMETIENKFDSIQLITNSGGEQALDFGAANNKGDNHYLTLDDRVYDGRNQLSIEMEFQLSFSRTDDRRHAYLLSLAENDERDNMLSIFLKHRTNSSDEHWDLSIWVMDDDVDDKEDQKIFVKKNWIEHNGRAVLWVAINLHENEISVFAGDDRDGLERVTNQCDASPPDEDSYADDSDVCQGNIDDIGSFKVGKGGAVFGNDQDDLADAFNHEQAFEGNFYGLKIYDKFFEPNDDGGIPEGVSLIYSLSPGNIKAED